MKFGITQVMVVVAGLCTGVLVVAAQGQNVSPPANGPRRSLPVSFTLVGATVHPEPGVAISNATVVVKDGRIVSVVAGGEAATEKRFRGPRWSDGVVDCRGLHLYAGLIDPFVPANTPRSLPTEGQGRHWNRWVTPELSVLDGPGLSAEDASGLRSLGFVAAGLSPIDPHEKQDGVIRGASAVVSLASPGEPSDPATRVYRSRAYQSIAFETVGGEEDVSRWSSYPSSNMGVIALVRQTLSDADFFALRSKKASAPAWAAALSPEAGVPLVFDAGTTINLVRAAGVATEFSRPSVFIGSGTEYQWIDAVKSAVSSAPQGSGSVILPISFPQAPDVGSLGKAESIEFRTLVEWEQAPTNPRRVSDAGIPASLTTKGLKDRKDFWPNLRRALDAGLDPVAAHAMVTTTPAKVLGVAEDLGAIAPGRWASMIVTDGELFVGEKLRGDTPAARIVGAWIDGRYEPAMPAPMDLTGVWTVRIPGAAAANRSIVIEGTAWEPAAVVRRDGKESPCKLSITGQSFNITFDHEPLDGRVGVFTMTGNVESDALGYAIVLVGVGVGPDGMRFNFSATRESDLPLVGLWNVINPGPGEPAAIEISPRSVVLRTKAGERDESDTRCGDVILTPEGATFSRPAGKPKELKGDERPPEKAAEPTDRAVLERGTLMWTHSTGGSSTTRQATRASSAAPRAVSSDLVGCYIVETRGEASRSPSVLVTIDQTGVISLDGGLWRQKPRVQSIKGNEFECVVDLVPLGIAGEAVVKGRAVEGLISGTAKLPGGEMLDWSARRRPGDPLTMASTPWTLPVPVSAFGALRSPERERVAITGATIWTSGPGGVIADGTVLVEGGKIVFVGPKEAGDVAMGTGAWRVVDGRGKHLTPGVIDCHSHTSLGSTNEFGQAVTAEVRVEDEMDPTNENWYRQLASGVTCVNTLHGSANAIGGQNSVTKLRWGTRDPLGMKFKEAPLGIKFALGENPRNANEGSRGTQRYPQTRMGVEGLIRDRLTVAREYAAARKAATPEKPVQRDLELDALAEILAGERLLHCHSYRQDEILMLATVAKDFAFTIGTYQHVLDGYKVAEIVRESAIGASGFADWWGYKIEVQDAIPQAFALMHRLGVVASVNSDDNELARRLTLEAVKSVRYGGISEEDALRFVTLNPAKQLKIDGRTGSIEVGKDADLALWSRSPMSTLTRCEATWVDGVLEFSVAQDEIMQKRTVEERSRIIQKAINSPSSTGKKDGGGDKGKPPGMSVERYFQLLSTGHEIGCQKAGDCGCSEVRR